MTNRRNQQSFEAVSDTGRIRAFVTRIERLDEEAKTLNDDRKAVYDEAGEAGLNKKALKQVIAARRKRANNPADFASEQHDFDAYMLALDGFEHNPASRAPAPARVDATEIIAAGTPAGDDGRPGKPSEPAAAPAKARSTAGGHLQAQGSQAADPNPMPAFLDRRKAARAHLEAAE